MKFLTMSAPAAAALVFLAVPGHATDLGGLGVSADVSVGGVASAGLGVGLGGSSGGSGGSGGGSSVAGVSVSIGGTGGGTGVGVSVGTGTGTGTPTGTGPTTPGTPKVITSNDDKLKSLDLNRLLGMAVISSDRKLLGVLDGIDRKSGQYVMRIRLSPSIATDRYVSVVGTQLPATSDVIQLRVSYRNFLSQI